VVVVGSATRDVTDADRRGWRLGGAVTYGSLTVARLGIRTAALVGVDTEASMAWELDMLRDAGVELVTVPLAHGPVFENVERPEGRVQTCMDPGDPLSPDALPPEWRSAPAWMLAPVAGELLDAWADIPPADAHVALGWQGILRNLRAGQRVERRDPRPSPLLARASLVAVSRHDVAAGTKLETLCTFLHRDVDLLLTCGELGGAMFQLMPAGIRHVRAYRAIPATSNLDPTGAGDVLLAAVLASRLAAGRGTRWEGRGPDSTHGHHDLLVAAAASSLVVEREGLDGVPSISDVRRRVLEAMHLRGG